jgi:hypothetical protein
VLKPGVYIGKVIAMVVLITDFEPNDDRVNASEVVVKSLAENLLLELTECRELLVFEVMPGNTNLLEDVLFPYCQSRSLKSQSFLIRHLCLLK